MPESVLLNAERERCRKGWQFCEHILTCTNCEPLNGLVAATSKRAYCKRLDDRDDDDRDDDDRDDDDRGDDDGGRGGGDEDSGGDGDGGGDKAPMRVL